MREPIAIPDLDRKTRLVADFVAKTPQQPFIQQWQSSIKKLARYNSKYLGPVCG